MEFEIPHLPVGKKLLLNIKDTWGDRYYVGLNGIEVFTDTGRPAEIAEVCYIRKWTSHKWSNYSSRTDKKRVMLLPGAMETWLQ